MESQCLNKRKVEENHRQKRRKLCDRAHRDSRDLTTSQGMPAAGGSKKNSPL